MLYASIHRIRTVLTLRVHSDPWKQPTKLEDRAASLLNERDQSGHPVDEAQVGTDTAAPAASDGAKSDQAAQPHLADKLREDLAGVRSQIEQRLESVDLAPDLAQDIGSRR